MDKILPYLLLAVMGFALAWFLKPQPDPVINTEIQYVKRPLAQKDTSGGATPIIITKYDTIPEIILDTVFVAIPQGVSDFNIITGRPLRFVGDKAQLTYYDPASHRWEQKLYRVPERSWKYGLDLYWAYGGDNHQAGAIYSGLEIYGGYKKFQAFGRLEVINFAENSRYMAGIKLKIK